VKFYELSKNQMFRFVERRDGDRSVWHSLGVDGAYGRYAERPGDFANMGYCRPLDEVEAVE
jgi:hypothetical protein